jgi:hypothetical protein
MFAADTTPDFESDWESSACAGGATHNLPVATATSVGCSLLRFRYWLVCVLRPFAEWSAVLQLSLAVALVDAAKPPDLASGVEILNVCVR